MKDQHRNDHAASGGEPREAQPWHAADEQPQLPQSGRRGAPLGTHSLTGGGVNVGIPSSPRADGTAERSSSRDMPPGAAQPDPLAEPRANVGEILGRKP
jgi:hypothetical protein